MKMNNINDISNGNRHSRRKDVAVARNKPSFDIKVKVSKNIFDSKVIGRKAKQKHIDEVKARTEARKKLK